METKKASNRAWKHVVCCVILLVIFVVTIGVHINAEGYSDEQIADNTSDVVPLRINRDGLIAALSYTEENEVKLAGPKQEVTVENDFNYYSTIYADEIKFFADTFRVDYAKVMEDLKKRSKKFTANNFEPTNIGYLVNKKGQLKKFNTPEYGIVEYFYDYVKKHPKEVNKKRVPYTGGAKYVEKLIIYYTTHVYTNVDTSTALSIGAAESGYYKVKYMLKANNVFGGMNSKGLIKYRNIEYGVLSYVRLLSRSYYGKGLTTIDKIGRKYCPTRDNNGYKIASPHWKKLVQTAIKKYKKYNFEIELSDLRSQRELA